MRGKNGAASFSFRVNHDIHDLQLTDDMNGDTAIINHFFFTKCSQSKQTAWLNRKDVVYRGWDGDGHWWAKWPARLIWTAWQMEKRNLNSEGGRDNGSTLAWLGSFRRVRPERAGSTAIATIFITVTRYWSKRQPGSPPSPPAFTCLKKDMTEMSGSSPTPKRSEAHTHPLLQGRQTWIRSQFIFLKTNQSRAGEDNQDVWSNERPGVMCQSQFLCEVKKGECQLLQSLFDTFAEGWSNQGCGVGR